MLYGNFSWMIYVKLKHQSSHKMAAIQVKIPKLWMKDSRPQKSSDVFSHECQTRDALSRCLLSNVPQICNVYWRWRIWIWSMYKLNISNMSRTWWRHHRQTLSVSLFFFVGNHWILSRMASIVEFWYFHWRTPEKRLKKLRSCRLFVW